MRQALLLFPFNGNAIEALDCLGGDFEPIAFIDDNPDLQGTTQYGLPVLDRHALAGHGQAKILAVPGCPEAYLRREEIVRGLGVGADRFATVIHPRASVSPRASLGVNCLVMAGVCVSGGAVIGDHVCLLPNSVVHHDSRVGDWCLIGSNVSVAGYVNIGRNVYIGSGSRVIHRCSIGDRALVGMGSTVIKSVEAGATVAGSPARVIRRDGQPVLRGASGADQDDQSE